MNDGKDNRMIRKQFIKCRGYVSKSADDSAAVFKTFLERADQIMDRCINIVDWICDIFIKHISDVGDNTDDSKVINASTERIDDRGNNIKNPLNKNKDRRQKFQCQIQTDFTDLEYKTQCFSDRAKHGKHSRCEI